MFNRLQAFFQKQSNYTTVILLIAILCLGFFVRHYNFRTIPREGATFDEYAWTWLGINLIQKHEPVSWSSQPQYTHRVHLVYHGARFWIVTPYLEHPPFFGLVAGSFALLEGVHNMYDVSIAKIRPLALILGAFSIFMVFVLANNLYGKAIGLLSALLYAVTPTIVIGSRLVQNENFLIPFWLLSLYLVSKYLKTRNPWFRNIAALIAGFLAISKVPWLVVGFSLGLILAYRRQWKDAIIVAGITLIVFSLFLIYGFVLDGQLFLNLWKLQTARYDINFAGFFSIFTNPLLADRYYLDGWILFGWLSVSLLAQNFKKYFFVLLPFVSYLILYIFAIPNEPAHGWYRYPFYPFLIIATAVFLYNQFKKIDLSSLFFILFVGLSLLANSWGAVFGFSFPLYRLFILLAAGTVLTPLFFKKYDKMGKGFLTFWLGFYILLSILSAVVYIE